MSIVERGHVGQSLSSLGASLDRAVIKPLHIPDRIENLVDQIDKTMFNDGWNRQYFYGEPLTEQNVGKMWQGYSPVALVYKQEFIDNGIRIDLGEVVVPTTLSRAEFAPAWQLLDYIDSNHLAECPPNERNTPTVQYKLVGIATPTPKAA